MADYVLSTATKAWSVYNIFRDQGLTSAAAILAYWEAANAGANVQAIDAAWVTTGINSLVSGGFITYPGSVVTAVTLDDKGKPARLRRTVADPLVLEFLPPGEQAESI